MGTNTTNQMNQLQELISDNKALLQKRDEQINLLQSTKMHLKKSINSREEQIVRLSEAEQQMQVELQKRDLQIRQLEAERQYSLGDMQNKESQLRQLVEAQEQYQQSLKDKESQVQQLVEAQEQYQQTLCDKEEQIQQYEEEKQQYQQTLLNKEGHIQQLIEAEREYQRVIASQQEQIAKLQEAERELELVKRTKSYRFTHWLRRGFDKVFPAYTKRRFFAKLLYRFITHPILVLRMLRPKRIKNFFYALKTEGMEGVEYYYNRRERMTRQEMDPASVLEFDKPADNKSVVEYAKFCMPVCKKPDVSIIIPVYNEFDYTYNCLKSILKNSGSVSYEVIIANDCSTDITTDLEKIISNVRVITTEHNVRFLLNCNNAAKYARGKYILFLNNDTQVQENWLAPLVELIERDDKNGMVGSKLVYPTGKLQEAGGIVWKDASAWNYGNQKDPEDPEYNYVKEADYISGAAIMIRRDLWEEIGGFDERFTPAYYEDTDLAFEVRKHGYKVLYQPLSVVVHFEGVSNGTDTSTGLKHYREVNFQKFYEKWKDELEKNHEENGVNVFTAKDRSGHKKQMLVVDHYVPHHDKDAGGKCTFMYLQLFLKMGFKVTFIGDNFFKHEPYTTELNQMGIEVLYGNYYYNNWQKWLKENSHYFDVIYLQRPHISIKYIDIVKKYSDAQIFYFAHDLHHVREMREYELTGDKEKLESAQKWKKIEYELFDKTDVGHVVGSYEQEIMQKAFPNKPIRNIPLYMYESTPNDIVKDFSKRRDLLYVGGFGHSPNVDAVKWFAAEVFPKVLEKYPDMKWHVVGSRPTEDIKALASENIIIEGFLSDADLEKLYRSCRLAVVPLRYGAGVKGKVVESAYYQIPLITTPIGAEGLSTKEGFMTVDESADDIAGAINSLYEDFEALRKMSDAGEVFIKNYFTVDAARQVMEEDLVK